jgi:hypothetical protein
LKIKTTEDVERWKQENPLATKEELKFKTKEIFEKYVSEYENKPPDFLPISISDTGRSFPTVEAATQQFQKEASPAYRFLADRIFSIVHLEKQIKVKRPLVPEEVEHSAEFAALPTHPGMTNEELAAYCGVAPLKTDEQKEMIAENDGIVIDDGNGNYYTFRKVKSSDNYAIDYADDDITEGAGLAGLPQGTAVRGSRDSRDPQGTAVNIWVIKMH